METLITYHMYLSWDDLVWRHRLYHMGREMTSLNIISLDLFLGCYLIKKILFQTSEENFDDEQNLLQFTEGR